MTHFTSNNKFRYLYLCLSSLILIGLILSGCAGVRNKTQPNKERAPNYTQPVGEGRSDSSLWYPESSRTFFFQDTKASHIGDIITVQIVESASGTKSAQTKSGRSSSLDATTGSVFGIPTSITDRFHAGASFSGSFDGSGSTTRSGTLTATLTAIVTKVFPNGNLWIEGEREVNINSEKEKITLSGLVRPEDIGPDNTILSSQVADAKIYYTGLGIINDNQRPGVVMRLVSWLWPF